MGWGKNAHVHHGKPTVRVAVLAYVIPDSAMSHSTIFGKRKLVSLSGTTIYRDVSATATETETNLTFESEEGRGGGNDSHFKRNACMRLWAW